jgi:hypothetical protein
MKTYPYHTPEGIIELVEQREYDELAELALQLANLRAEDMATIKARSVMIDKLANALTLITEEYEDRRFQFGDDPLWQKHEGNNPLPTAFAALDAYESANFEPVANPIDEAVKRMEAVPVLELNKLHFDAMDYGNFNDIEAVRARLIQAAKGEA